MNKDKEKFVCNNCEYEYETDKWIYCNGQWATFLECVCDKCGKKNRHYINACYKLDSIYETR